MKTIKKLDNSFYARPNVQLVARELLGKVLVTEFEGQRTSGRIVEVEAYNGVVDRASHAWSGRRTRRTEVMYREGGTAYVYLIYGIHHLFNAIVTSEDVTAQKPAPDIFLEAARRIGVAPGLCRAYEDTDLGLQGIRAAGMEAVDVRKWYQASPAAYGPV